jgi:hypothetical protein
VLYESQIIVMKASIVQLYLRMFPASISRRSRIACYLLLTGGGLFLIGASLVFIFACNPTRISWQQYYPRYEDKCIHLPAAFYFAVAFNIITDLLVFCLPVPKM